ncbi:MAG: UbiA family prenyltransferase [Desulfobulbaceae bacterium]|nr:UbiA family prenyltransferase [Desulfobulbaceae bacterium]
MFGYALAQNNAGGGLAWVLSGMGVFLLATGGASLNSLQEHQLDATMQRTKGRPLVQGRLSKTEALVQAVLLIACGLTIIYFVAQSFSVMLVGAVALVLYNGIYTPLKSKSVWAVFPGALCGAIPPYIGWLSGGGAALSFIPMLLFSLFILWQIPHFWLVILKHSNDYLDTELPNLLLIFKEEKLKRFFITWIGALVVTMLMFLTQFPYTGVWQLIIVTNSLVLFLAFVFFSLGKKDWNYGIFFIFLNMSIVIHMFAVVAGMKV